TLFYSIAILVLAMMPLQGHGADTHVTATIEPAQIRLGEGAQLTITVEGTANANAPNIPPVAGLDVKLVGHSTNLQFINGAMSGGVSFSYQVIPHSEGDFAIPELNVMVGGENLKTHPINLKVLKPSTGYGAPSQQQPTQNAPAAPSSASQISSDAALLKL